MGEYTEQYSYAHDVDCFFRWQGMLFHFASNGNLIPSFIDEENNRHIQRLVYNRLIDNKNDIKENCIRYEGTVKQILRNDGYKEILQKDIDNYLESFSSMACIGFYSFDCIDGSLVPMAAPKNGGMDNSSFYREVLEYAPEIILESQLIPQISNMAKAATSRR